MIDLEVKDQKKICTKNIIKSIREKIRRNPKRSTRKLAKEQQMSERSKGRIIKNDFKIKFAYITEESIVISSTEN